MDIPKELYNKYGEASDEEINVLRIREDYYDNPSVEDCNEYGGTSRIGLLRNLIAFAEIVTYKGKYLRTMDKKDLDLATEGIIADLPYLHEKPVAYEIKENSVVICYIVSPACSASEIDTILGVSY